MLLQGLQELLQIQEPIWSELIVSGQFSTGTLAALRATCSDAKSAVDAAPAAVWGRAALGLLPLAYLSNPAVTSCSIQDGLRTHVKGSTKLSRKPELRLLRMLPEDRPDSIFWSADSGCMALASSMPVFPFSSLAMTSRESTGVQATSVYNAWTAKAFRSASRHLKPAAGRAWTWVGWSPSKNSFIIQLSDGHDLASSIGTGSAASQPQQHTLHLVSVASGKLETTVQVCGPCLSSHVSPDGDRVICRVPTSHGSQLGAADMNNLKMVLENMISVRGQWALGAAHPSGSSSSSSSGCSCPVQAAS